LQRIRQPLLGAAGAKRLLLAFMRGPAGQEHQIEGRFKPTLGRGEIRKVGCFGSGKNRTAGEMAWAGGKGVGFAHRAQIGAKRGEVRVVDGLGQAVGDGQRKPGPLHQRAKVANLAHRQHAGRQAASDPSLSLGKAGAKFVQGAASGQDRDEKPVRSQGAAALDQLASRIVRPVQRHGVDHQIMRAGFKVQSLGIGDHPGFAVDFLPDFGESGDNGGGRKGSVNLDQSFLNVRQGKAMQKLRRCMARQAAGAVALAVKGQPVGEDWGRGHRRDCRGTGMGMQAALHLLYPPQCISCAEPVISDFGLCSTCWRETPFIAGLVCDQCGMPLPGADTGERAICDDCMAIARPWEQGRAALMYQDNGRSLVLALKHGDRMDLARPTAVWMAKAAQPLLKPGMLAVPVPLHWFRLLRRKYNQAALLSAAIARLAGLEHCPDTLIRKRPTGTQDGRTRDGRFANLVGAFRVPDRRRNLIQGRDILLVDDVMTSGATFACGTEALMAAGARSVNVLSLARVAKDA
jgi:ComF family protein